MFIREGVTDDNERLGDIAAVLALVLGQEDGLRAFDQCVANISEEYFVRGRLLGGQEIFNMVKSHGEETPMGLRNYLGTGV